MLVWAVLALVLLLFLYLVLCGSGCVCLIETGETEVLKGVAVYINLEHVPSCCQYLRSMFTSWFDVMGMQPIRSVRGAPALPAVRLYVKTT